VQITHWRDGGSIEERPRGVITLYQLIDVIFTFAKTLF
jgi:hypothetical protein